MLLLLLLSKSHISHLKLKRLICHDSQSSLEKRTRVQTQNGQSLNPFSDQNGAQLPDGVAHTYIAYTGEYPPGGVCSRPFEYWQ